MDNFILTSFKFRTVLQNPMILLLLFKNSKKMKSKNYEKNFKKNFKNKNLKLYIYDLIKIGINPARICLKLKIRPPSLYYYTNFLKKNNLIIKKGYGTWEINPEITYKKVKNICFRKNVYRTSKKFSMGARETNLHALNINVPILRGNLDLIKDFKGYTQSKFNNWLPQYKKFINPIGFTAKNNNNKSLDLQIWSRKLFNLDEIHQLILKTLIYTQHIFKEKEVIIDIFNAKTKTLHISIKDEDIDKVLNKGTKIEVFLNRNKAKILDKDKPKEAIVWTDASPFRGIESNDLQYIKNYIIMPERVDQMAKTMIDLKDSLNVFAEGMKQHMILIKELQNTAKSMHQAQSFINKNLQQTSSKPTDLQHLFKNPHEFNKLTNKEKTLKIKEIY